MIIYTSYFGNLKHIPPKILPVSIARFPPRWYKGHQMKSLAPPEKLLWKAKQGKTDKEDYRLQYLGEIEKRFTPSSLYDSLISTCGGQDIALLCFEKRGQFCHRRILAQWLEEIPGVEVKEL